MPTAVERHAYLPVLLFTYSGAITLENMIDVYYKSLALITPNDVMMYRLIHVESLESNFAEILKIAQSSAAPATPDPSPIELHLIVVGHDKWTKLYLQLMSQQQFGGVSIPCFVTVDQALDYVRDQMKKEAS